MSKKLLMFFLMGMFMISFASAVDWDNSLSYKDNNKNVKVENLFGLPIIGTELASIKITSHEDLSKPIYVGTGWQEVMRIEVNSKQEYKDAIKGIEFKNMKNNEMEELSYYWEKAVYGQVEKKKNVCEIRYDNTFEKDINVFYIRNVFD